MRWFAQALVVAAFLGGAEAVAQTPATTPLSQIYACADQTDDAARLQCYDQAAAQLRAAEQTGQVLAVDREQVAALERESFGFQLPSLSSMLPNFNGAPQQIERVETQVERVLSLADGRHTFVLANGQSWTQIEPRSVSNVRAGDSIAIRRAALGSFMLSPEHGAAHRVRRSS